MECAWACVTRERSGAGSENCGRTMPIENPEHGKAVKQLELHQMRILHALQCTRD